MYKLSKSTFVRGCQCEKSFYLNKHHKSLRDSISENQQQLFSQGTKVGILAQQLFPGGTDVTPIVHLDFKQAVKDTYQALARGVKTIYEATFVYDEILVAVDILHRDEDGWKVYEVKSSTDIKEVNILDAALQYYVISKVGMQLQDFSIIHINNQYIRDGELNIHQLFATKSIIEQAKAEQNFVQDKLKKLRPLLKKSEIPEQDIGVQCFNPYTCDFMGYCWKGIPDYSVFNIANLKLDKKFDLYNQGYITFHEVPNDYPLSEFQKQQIDIEVSGDSIIEKELIRKFIDGLTEPLYYLDFETFQMAIPLYNQCRPYQQQVFQYSLHQTNGKELKHREFLGKGDGSDERENFIQQLILDLEDTGDILVYNISFERTVLEGLATLFPQYQKPIEQIISRLVDLMIPFQKRWYYTPEMKGSYSIKVVLPALVPELSYNNLEIQEGSSAGNAYASMMSGAYKGDYNILRNSLLEYCKMDTFAMVKILEKLKLVV